MNFNLFYIVVGNFMSIVVVDGKFVKLRIFKNNINVYEWSLICVDDFCFSVRVIGGVGIVILCLVVGLIFFLDCVLYFEKISIKFFKKVVLCILDLLEMSVVYVYVEKIDFEM